jgi:predicted RNA-binding protein YlqC (UPF0109 family)
MKNMVLREGIAQKIYLIRGKKVMLDEDLAQLYRVKTGNLNKAVNRNIRRFPNEFMFKLTAKEYNGLRFQNGISNRGGRRYLPHAFTEHGIVMLSSILNSERAIHVNIFIVRVFIKLSKILAANEKIDRKVKEHGKIIGEHSRHITAIYQLIDELMAPLEEKTKKKIGFHP